MTLKHTLILGLLSVSVCAFAQDKKTPAQSKDAPAQSKDAAADHGEAEQKAWMAYMTPGEMHKMLASSNGSWKEELTFWMDPSAPPQKAEAECTNTMIMGDRYQESIHKGMMFGMPFEGRSTVGYDNAKKVFQSTWVDNMGTGIMFLEGKWDDKSNSIVFTGKTVDPASGKEENVREVFKIVDDNTHLMEMYMTKNGKEYKNMEIKFTRKG